MKKHILLCSLLIFCFGMYADANLNKTKTKLKKQNLPLPDAYIKSDEAQKNEKPIVFKAKKLKPQLVK